MTTTMSLTPYRALAVLALATLGFVPALFAHAATASISATPTHITTGQSATLTWACGSGSNASLNQGIGTVTQSGSMQVSPTTSKTYTLICTDSTGTTQSSVTITVNTQGCYADAYLEGVYGNMVSNTYTDSLFPQNVIFDEPGVNSLNGGGSYDSQNHYQQCINACADYGNCTYKQVVDFGSGEMSLSRFTCTYANPNQDTRSNKPMETVNFLPSEGSGISTETVWHAIVWRETTGGSCPTLPPPPTVTLTANPTTVQSGQSSTLTWSSTNADYCTRVGGTFGSTPPAGTAVSGNKSVTLTQTTDFYVTCYNESGSAQANARVTVGTAPDLIASAITPTAAVAGQATTFQTTVSNTGGAGTGGSFSVLFQVANSATGSGGSNLGVKTQSAIAANGSATVTYSATFPTAGQVYMRACADKPTGGSVNGVIVETNESNNCGPWTLITVTAGAMYPNLTTSVPSPGSAVVGTPKTFSSTVVNNGGATTGSGFTNVFIVNNTQDFTTPIATYTDTSPALMQNGTDGISATHTFNTAGTYYVGACADRNAAGVGTIAESNESVSDNCKWRTVTVTSTEPPSGGDLTCSYTVGGPTGKRITYTALPDKSGQYTWTVTPSVEGSPATTNRNQWMYTYLEDGFYSVVVSHADGSEGTCPLVTVGDPCVNPEIDITANPDRVQVGDTTTLIVSATGVSGTSCTVSGAGWTSSPIPVNMCVVEEVSLTSPTINTQTTFTVTCDDDTASTVVNVIPKFQEF